MTSKISELAAPDYSDKLGSIRDLLHDAQAKVTPWKGRIIIVQGVTESFSLNRVASKVLTADYTREKARNLTQDDRDSGVEIVKSIQKLYRNSDNQLKQANYLTQLLCGLWDLVFNLSTCGGALINAFMYTDRFRLSRPAEGFFNIAQSSQDAK